MNWEPFASRTTQITLTDTNPVEVAGGSSIRIWGFIVSEVSGVAKSVTLRSSDGNTIYANIRMRPNITVVSSIKWIADKGLEVVASAGNAEITIFHNNPGN